MILEGYSLSLERNCRADGENKTVMETSCCCCLVAKLYLTLLQSHRLQPARLLCPWDFPGKNIGVGCHFLFQGIFTTRGSSQPRDQSRISCIDKWVLYQRAIGDDSFPLLKTKKPFSLSISSIHSYLTRDGMDLTEAEDINKRGQEYT